MEIGLRRLIDDSLAVHVDESRRYNAAKRAVSERDPDPDVRTPEGRAVVRRRRGESTAPPGRTVSEHMANADGRSVPVRVITPAEGAVQGIYLDLHGGGFYMESAARNDAPNARMADAAGVAVVSVDYRLAPEHPWPAAPDDCETAARWILSEGRRRFGADGLVIGGASAGANLAMVTLARLRDGGVHGAVAGVVLQFGAYDLSGRSPGSRRYADEWFIGAYAGHVTDRSHPDISPLYAELHDLPPALIVVGADDILLEDSLVMGARFAAAGGDVDVRIYPESGHGFTGAPTAMACAAVDGIDTWVARRLAATSCDGAPRRVG